MRLRTNIFFSVYDTLPLTFLNSFEWFVFDFKHPLFLHNGVQNQGAMSTHICNHVEFLRASVLKHLIQFPLGRALQQRRTTELIDKINKCDAEYVLILRDYRRTGHRERSIDPSRRGHSHSFPNIFKAQCEAISMASEKALVDVEACIDCGVCVDACPEEAITME